jgi:hypothetical protein
MVALWTVYNAISMVLRSLSAFYSDSGKKVFFVFDALLPWLYFWVIPTITPSIMKPSVGASMSIKDYLRPTSVIMGELRLHSASNKFCSFLSTPVMEALSIFFFFWSPLITYSILSGARARSGALIGDIALDEETANILVGVNAIFFCLWGLTNVLLIIPHYEEGVPVPVPPLLQGGSWANQWLNLKEPCGNECVTETTTGPNPNPTCIYDYCLKPLVTRVFIAVACVIRSIGGAIARGFHC